MASREKKRPGVMIYFELRLSLRRLSREEKGDLFDAILDYGETGVLPDFDGVLGVVWDFVQPRIDADANAYRERCEQSAEAAKRRWEKRMPLGADECGGIRLEAEHANINTIQSISTSKPNSITAETSHSMTAGEKGVQGGELPPSPPDGELIDVGPLSESEFERARREKLKSLQNYAIGH